MLFFTNIINLSNTVLFPSITSLHVANSLKKISWSMMPPPAYHLLCLLRFPCLPPHPDCDQLVPLSPIHTTTRTSFLTSSLSVTPIPVFNKHASDRSAFPSSPNSQLNFYMINYHDNERRAFLSSI